MYLSSVCHTEASAPKKTLCSDGSPIKFSRTVHIPEEKPLQGQSSIIILGLPLEAFEGSYYTDDISKAGRFNDDCGIFSLECCRFLEVQPENHHPSEVGRQTSFLPPQTPT
jgi:hypothetical protein